MANVVDHAPGEVVQPLKWEYAQMLTLLVLSLKDKIGSIGPDSHDANQRQSSSTALLSSPALRSDTRRLGSPGFWLVFDCHNIWPLDIAAEAICPPFIA
jgi:hypothetical protein